MHRNRKGIDKLLVVRLIKNVEGGKILFSEGVKRMCDQHGLILIFFIIACLPLNA